MKKIFIDMDGCLAEFKDVPFKALYEPGYFRNLKPLDNVVSGLRMFKERHPEIQLSVLSCVLSDRPGATEEKISWLKEHAPFLMDNLYFVPCGTNKGLLATGGESFLLDDYSKNVIEFDSVSENHHGVKLLNGINGKGIQWKGVSISASLDPAEFSESLYRIVS